MEEEVEMLEKEMDDKIRDLQTTEMQEAAAAPPEQQEYHRQEHRAGRVMPAQFLGLLPDSDRGVIDAHNLKVDTEMSESCCTAISAHKFAHTVN